MWFVCHRQLFWHRSYLTIWIHSNWILGVQLHGNDHLHHGCKITPKLDQGKCTIRRFELTIICHRNWIKGSVLLEGNDHSN